MAYRVRLEKIHEDDRFVVYGGGVDWQYKTSFTQEFLRNARLDALDAASQEAWRRFLSDARVTELRDEFKKLRYDVLCLTDGKAVDRIERIGRIFDCIFDHKL